MRPVLAILITTLLLGGTFAYTRFAASVRHSAVEYNAEFADESYVVEIRRTFTAVSNPDSDFDSSLKLRFKGELVINRNDEIPPTESLVVAKLSDVEIGENELFILANTETSFSDFAALNVRVTKNGLTIAESSFTNVPGSPLIYGAVTFIAQHKPEDAHSH